MIATLIEVRATSYSPNAGRLSDIVTNVTTFGQITGEEYAQMVASNSADYTAQGNEVSYMGAGGIKNYFTYTVIGTTEV